MKLNLGTDIAAQLSGTKRRKGPFWTDGSIKIPKRESPSRNEYDRDYRADVLKGWDKSRWSILQKYVDARDLVTTNRVVNRARYGLYKRMLRANEEVPPIVIIAAPGALMVFDGNHRTQAALDTRRTILPAFVMTRL